MQHWRGDLNRELFRVYQYPTRSEWRKQFMSGLRKKLDSLGTEMGLMEMMLAVYID